MPGKGNYNRGRGKGRSRGRGRGAARGGGRGRNRDLIATSVGYVYRLQSNVADFDDDFRIYGQFSSSEEDSEIENILSNLKSRKNNFSHKKQHNRPRLIEDDNEVLHFPVGSSHPNTATAKSNNQFARGKSKYFRTVAFTKSSTVLNSPDESASNSKDPEKKQENENGELVDSLSKLTVSEIGGSLCDNKLRSPNKRTNITTVETFDFDDFENDINSSGYSSSKNYQPESDDVLKAEASNVTVQTNQSPVENILDGYGGDKKQLFTTEDDSDDNLTRNDLLAASEEDDEDLYDYATLDQDNESDDLSDEEMNVISSFSHINENIRKKKSHRTRDEHATVDSEIFGQSLQAALADVPLGLKPGMRRWFEKQQRKESRKKKNEEAKAFRKEKKKKKGKSVDNDYSVQLVKIDRRINDFIADESINSYQFSPMAAHIRRQIHIIAAFYNLSSESVGSAESRCTIITKTKETKIPKDRRSIDRFLINNQASVDEQARIIEKKKNKPISNTSGSSTPKAKLKPAGSQLTPGTVVAFNAPPIDEDNVGHKMLAAMGWKQGDALGSKNEGIIAPIEAIIRKKNQGLGS